MKKIGFVLTAIWLVASLYLIITSQEMEILFALYFAIIGGFIVINYFLVTWIITSYRDGKNLLPRIILFGFWLMSPLVVYGVSNVVQITKTQEHETFLKNNVPTEQSIRSLSEGFLTEYVNESDSFFSYRNKVLVLSYKVNEEIALQRFQYLIQNTNSDNIQNVIIEDFIGREILSIHLLHSSIWHETLHPDSITISLYFENELFYKTVSVQGSEGQLDGFLDKHQELYKRFQEKLP
ncbi:hypothetical protein [Fredinandcohnia sp. 179-A 10B2 NHS]|uniref:hypothetical protein n=1 Tax=Fredinandcohnia sp. 179-A 10B2 NHS TaxID=3235176 RepID=UPI0039A28A0D